MDPLTHTLVGANIGRAVPAGRSRGVLATAIIGANLPDVDAVTYFMDSDISIGFRRGWTHGVLALVVLPLLLWGAITLWVRWRDRELEPGQSRLLLMIAFLSVWTHPFLDWLNNYGMRWLMPFDETWTYGDSVFIIDPWLWMILGVPLLVATRRSWAVLAGWAVVSLLLVRLVGSRSAVYVGVVAVVSLLLFVAILWRPQMSESSKRNLGRVTLAAALAWVGILLAVHSVTLSAVRSEVSSTVEPEVVFVGPRPMNPFRWDVLVRRNGVFDYGTVLWPKGELRMAGAALPSLDSSEYADAVRGNPEIEGYMSWVRFPWVSTVDEGDFVRVHVLDARYTREVMTGFGGRSVIVPREQGERGENN